MNSDQGVDPNSWNQFAYVGGSPFQATDPSGNCLEVYLRISTFSGNGEIISETWTFLGYEDCSRGGGGGGSAKKPQTKKDIYKDLQKKINDCIKALQAKIKSLNAIPIQSMKNAPTVITNYPSSRLDQARGRVGLDNRTGNTVGLPYMPSPGNPNGSIYIASDITDFGSSFGTMYVHELGNILDMRYNNNFNANSWGNPDAWDPDSGQALEDCVFGK